MRILLSFAGSIIYLVVMTVISPLLVAVYAGLRSVHYFNTHRPLAGIHLSPIKIPALHISVKKQFAMLWTRAARFHF
jgi:hypothetical protein